jgi:hypothetical protein
MQCSRALLRLAVSLDVHWNQWLQRESPRMLAMMSKQPCYQTADTWRHQASTACNPFYLRLSSVKHECPFVFCTEQCVYNVSSI